MNRRDFLKSAAPATVATGLAASVAIAPPTAAATPALAALAETAFTADKAHVAALDDLEGCKARFVQLVGDPPPLARWRGAADTRANIGGRPDTSQELRYEFYDRGADEREARRWIARSDRLESAITRERVTCGDTPKAARLCKRLAAVEAYEAHKLAAFAESGIEAAQQAISSAEYVASKAARAVIEHPAKTPADLALKVRAWECLKRADKYGGNLNSMTPIVMADALRICGAST